MNRNFLLFFISTALVLLSFVIPRYWVYRLPTVCTFKIATGMACPGCGVTRSLVAATNGYIAEAVRWHLFGPLALFLGGALSLYSLMAAVTRRGFILPVDHPRFTLMVVLGFSSLLVYWVIRLLTGTAP